MLGEAEVEVEGEEVEVALFEAKGRRTPSESTEPVSNRVGRAAALFGVEACRFARAWAAAAAPLGDDPEAGEGFEGRG